MSNESLDQTLREIRSVVIRRSRNMRNVVDNNTGVSLSVVKVFDSADRDIFRLVAASSTIIESPLEPLSIIQYAKNRAREHFDSFGCLPASEDVWNELALQSLRLHCLNHYLDEGLAVLELPTYVEKPEIPSAVFFRDIRGTQDAIDNPRIANWLYGEFTGFRRSMRYPNATPIVFFHMHHESTESPEFFSKNLPSVVSAVKLLAGSQERCPLDYSTVRGNPELLESFEIRYANDALIELLCNIGVMRKLQDTRRIDFLPAVRSAAGLSRYGGVKPRKS